MRLISTLLFLFCIFTKQVVSAQSTQPLNASAHGGTAGATVAQTFEDHSIDQAPIAESKGETSGFFIQTRLPVHQNVNTFLGIQPAFVLGVRWDRFGAGVGVGFNNVRASLSKNAITGTIITLVPTIMYDIWRSRDNKVRFNILGQVGLGFGSLTTEESRNTGTTETSASATLLPITLGFGGDYFLHRNFGLGAEIGLNAMFLVDADVENIAAKAGFGQQSIYGALRATFLFN